MRTEELSLKDRREAKKEADRKEKARIRKWIEEHPRWNSFTRNQKRNMRKRLMNRR